MKLNMKQHECYYFQSAILHFLLERSSLIKDVFVGCSEWSCWSEVILCWSTETYLCFYVNWCACMDFWGMTLHSGNTKYSFCRLMEVPPAQVNAWNIEPLSAMHVCHLSQLFWSRTSQCIAYSTFTVTIHLWLQWFKYAELNVIIICFSIGSQPMKQQCWQLGLL